MKLLMELINLTIIVRNGEEYGSKCKGKISAWIADRY